MCIAQSNMDCAFFLNRVERVVSESLNLDYETEWFLPTRHHTFIWHFNKFVSLALDQRFRILHISRAAAVHQIQKVNNQMPHGRQLPHIHRQVPHIHRKAHPIFNHATHFQSLSSFSITHAHSTVCGDILERIRYQNWITQPNSHGALCYVYVVLSYECVATGIRLSGTFLCMCGKSEVRVVSGY
jgi:hypothetical protein